MALGRAVRVAFAAGAGLLATACAALYTSPEVLDGSVFGESGTDLKVEIVRLTFESTTKANLTQYVPQRLPLGFQPGVLDKIEPEEVTVPRLSPRPAPVTRPNRRPTFIANNPPPITAPAPYTIGIADVLLLSANAGDANLDAIPALISAQSKRQGFVVQDDGAIAIPNVGRVRVAGLTMQDAEAVIFQALVAAGIDPSFSFEISDFNSQRVSISGEVRAPQLVPITLKPLYLHEAISAAGGLAVIDAAVARIQMVRGGRRYQISARRYLRDPRMRQVVMRDGDSVTVISDYREERAQNLFREQIELRQQELAESTFQFQALQVEDTRRTFELQRAAAERQIFQDRLELGAVKRDYAYLTGEAVLPARFPLPFEAKAKLADVLFDNRGLNINFADYSEIYVLRRSSNPEESGALTAYNLDASNAANLALASMFDIHAGDVVFVAEQPITAWNRAISQALPNLLLSAANVATNF